MKKISAFILVAVLLLCGCSNSTEKNEITVQPQNENKESEIPEEVVIPEDVVAPKEESVIVSSLYGKIIVVDPGHGINSYSKQEPVAPGSSQMKAAFVSGTRGANQTEEQLNLSVGLKLKAALEAKGATVYMTRETHECDVSNVDRAKMANDLNADIAVRIHADGSENSSARGVSVLVPGNQYIKDNDLITKSRSAGESVLVSFAESTGAQNRGISVRNDMTGFNWSTVPVILVEMGFMTNPEEDRLMETEDYQNKMVNGMVNGLEKYFE